MFVGVPAGNRVNFSTYSINAQWPLNLVTIEVQYAEVCWMFQERFVCQSSIIRSCVMLLEKAITIGKYCRHKGMQAFGGDNLIYSPHQARAKYFSRGRVWFKTFFFKSSWQDRSCWRYIKGSVLPDSPVHTSECYEERVLFNTFHFLYFSSSPVSMLKHINKSIVTDNQTISELSGSTSRVI